jgi:chemotaxis protein CheD
MPNSSGPRLKKLVSIHIGEYYVSRESVVIYTLLGSCVAVCLYDPISRIGGMNHILMPGQADLRHFDSSARYGINAMELLINQIMNLGGKRHNLVAKVFGGARTLSTIPEKHSMGKKNIQFVLEFLQNESIRVLARDLGGYQSRKVYFHADSGEVFLKRTKSMDFTVLEMEKKATEDICKKCEDAGDITLF